MKQLPPYTLLVSLLFLLTACGNNGSKVTSSASVPPPVEKFSRLVAPVNGSRVLPGTPIDVRVALSDSLVADSIEVFFEGSRYVLQGTDHELQLATDGVRPGRRSLRVSVYLPDGRKESEGVNLTVLSDIVPKRYTYRVLASFPHDPGAYTQGLEYVDGWFYEGTGQKGESSLRRVSPEDGKVVQIRSMSSQLFGEGITLFGDRIYQLTYHAQVGFVYDKKSFEEIQKVYYQNKEGWGLTNNGKELIMSDGTNILYFLDPESFAVIRQVEVYDNEGPVDSLNELEFINGKIFANRYYTDEIEIIDPLSGKIEGKVNLKGILPVTERKPNTDVLNGIAWDKKGQRLFVTGKYWPKMYQIELISLD